MHRKSSTKLLPLDLELERNLFRRKKAKVDNIEMEDQNSDRFSEGHLDHSEMLGIRDPTLGDCCRLIMNIDDNNFQLKLALINMV